MRMGNGSVFSAPPDEISPSTFPERFAFSALSLHYSAKGIPKPLVEKSIRNSIAWGIYFGALQVGFARVISDKATFAYLCDVFIAPEHRGKGLSKALVAAIKAHPDLQGLRRWMLVTVDAHGLYQQFDFQPVENPERHMEIHQPGLYLEGQPPA